MNKFMTSCFVCLALVASCSHFPRQEQPRPLSIYWIDVEGGGATFIVTPGGESVLMDAGWPTEDERDATRIIAAMSDAGIAKIDYFVASHYHDDHIGGVAALAKRVPIGQFVDYGDNMDQSLAALDDYLAAVEGKRRIIVPGDTLPLAGISFAFTSANGSVLDDALGNSGSNPHCQGASVPTVNNLENSHSVGYLLSLGGFEFLNLGDLTVDVQHELACPTNLIGVVDLYQIPHHGDDIAPQLTWALAPTVAVINNGARKGGGAAGFEVVGRTPDIQAIWQVHRSVRTDDEHSAPEDLIANPTEENDEGNWIKATVGADGARYTIANGRNGYTETYESK
jgi:beta-lactamase superfamily II metal-dependent hydrolase